MKILLHICCGPCATIVIERLKEKGFEIKGFFYNPNIYPKEEYDLRRANVELVANHYNIEIIPSLYEKDKWHEKIRGYEYTKEKQERCRICIEMRLFETGKKAKEENFDMFTTTLFVGPNKDSRLILLYGARIQESLGIPFYGEDFKKKGGFQESVVLSKKMGLYRQKYCGCVYSLREKPIYSKL